MLHLIAALALTQNVVLDDPLTGSTSGSRSGGSLQADGWRVTARTDSIVWHLPTLPQGAVEWSVRGLVPNDGRAEGADKNEIFHMYDWTYGNADTVYDGYRNNPYKHFVRKSNVLNGAKTDSMEFLWKIFDNYTEPDSPVLSWDPGTTYKFRQEWAPDGAGNTTIRTWRDGALIMTMSQPGSWSPSGHAFRIAASPRAALYTDFGAPVDAVFSGVKVWDAPGGTGGGGGGGGTGDGVRRGLVRLVGNSIEDDGGPFLGLGWTYMTALWQCRNNRAKLRSDLAFMKQNGFNYLRALGQVAGDYWSGLEIAPVECRNENGTTVPAWPDYVQQLRDLLDIAWDEYGIRTEISIFGSGANIPSGASGRQTTVDLVLQAVAGREQKVILVEVANEGWQNGFPGSTGDAELRSLCDYIGARTNVPVAITSNHEGDMQALYAGTDADLATWHFSRDLGPDEGWEPVYDCWKVELIPGFPPTSSNEPIGPGSSVNTENNPIKLAMAAAFAYTAKLPMYVFHSGAGVRHVTQFEDMAGVRDFVHVMRILPPDLANWSRNDGKEAAALFTAFAGGQANRYWPENGAGDGCVRNIGGRRGGDFVCVPIGIRPGGLTLQARQAVSFSVYHPLTGQVVDQRSLNAGEQFTLPQGPGAYIITNVAPGSGGGGGGTGGLKAEYFDNIDFTGTKVARTDATVNFDWADGSPAAGIGPDTFSVRWTGQVDPQHSEVYTFYTQSDDGVRLWVNGVLLIDNWWDHGMEENSGAIALTAGQKVDVRLDYYENGGGAAVRLLWSSASQGKEVVPQGRLFPPPPPPPGNGTGLTGEYFHNADLTAAALSRTDATVNFDWGGSSPDPSIGADTFSVRWTGQVDPHYSETYTFYTHSDDGVRLWVNGVLLIDNWWDHGMEENSGRIGLTAGQRIDVRLDYYENGGGAAAKLLWSSASQAKEIVPQSQLHPSAIPAGTNDALFVSQSVPSTMVAGGRYTVSVTMRNSGTTTWTAAQGYRLGSQNPQDNTTWGVNRTDLGAGDTVAPGQEKTFTFDVIAPTTPGTYGFQRRMLRELVEWFGDVAPIATVTVTSGGSGPLVAISSVSTGLPYSLATAQAGQLAYIDRSYRITGLSAALDGGVLVRTANNDKYVATASHLTLQLGQQAQVYVCLDRRAGFPPRWLDSDDTWVLTGEALATEDGGASPMAVYSKTLPAGPVTLGGNHHGGDTGARSNYLVVVQPAGSPKVVNFVEGPMAPDVWYNPGDSDGDGLQDGFETSQGLNPSAVDTDGDGGTDESEPSPDGRSWWDVQAAPTAPVPDGGGSSGGGGNCGLLGIEGLLLFLLFSWRRVRSATRIRTSFTGS